MKGEIKEKDEQRRKSKDKKLDREGRILIAVYKGKRMVHLQ